MSDIVSAESHVQMKDEAFFVSCFFLFFSLLFTRTIKDEAVFPPFFFFFPYCSHVQMKDEVACAGTALENTFNNKRTHFIVREHIL